MLCFSSASILKNVLSGFMIFMFHSIKSGSFYCLNVDVFRDKLTHLELYKTYRTFGPF